jgi:hypothetical protein
MSFKLHFGGIEGYVFAIGSISRIILTKIMWHNVSKNNVQFDGQEQSLWLQPSKWSRKQSNNLNLLHTFLVTNSASLLTPR